MACGVDRNSFVPTDVADHIPELTRRLRHDVAHSRHADIHALPQPSAIITHDAALGRRIELHSRNHEHLGAIEAVLDDLEFLNSGKIAHRIDECQPVHHCAVDCMHEVGGAALYFLEDWQAAAASAMLVRQDADVPGAVADEREFVRCGVGDHDLARLAGGQYFSVGIAYFDNDVLGLKM